MESALIIIIVGSALIYLVRKFYRNFKQTGGSQCGCGCTACPSEKDCNESPTQSVSHIWCLAKRPARIEAGRGYFNVQTADKNQPTKTKNT